MTGQNKSAAIDHFDGCMQWNIIKSVVEVINYKNNVFQKGISPNAKRVTTIVQKRFGRQLFNYVTKHRWKCPTFRQNKLLHKMMIIVFYFKH